MTASDITGHDLAWFDDAVYQSGATVFDYGVGEVRTGPDVGTTGDSTVDIHRFGDGIFPIDVRVTFANGVIANERWDGHDRIHVFRYSQAAPISRVEVDPDRVLMLDLHRTNNSWSARPAASIAARRWTVHWLTWLEDVLVTYAALG